MHRSQIFISAFVATCWLASGASAQITEGLPLNEPIKTFDDGQVTEPDHGDPDLPADPELHAVVPRAVDIQPSYPTRSELVRTSGASRERYVEGAPVPPGATVVEGRRRWPIMLGAGLFLGVYAVPAGVAAGVDGAEELYIPIVGPFMAAADVASANISFVTMGVALVGVVQAAGLGLLTYGLFGKVKYLEYYAESHDRRRHVAIRPSIGSLNGLSVDLDFMGAL